jgi:hypothetical protein
MRQVGTTCAPVHSSDADSSTPDSGSSTPNRGSAKPDSGAADECLADQDHDGFGVEGVMAPCTGVEVQPGDCDDSNAQAFPGAPIDRCDHADNDCDGKDEPPTAEVCNGLDDDCKNGVDNGVLNACGQCGEVPEEICNGVDDDCDGVTDPNMIEKLLPGGEHVFTQAGQIGLKAVAQVALVPRVDGSGWLISRAGGSQALEPSELQFAQLGKEGTPAAERTPHPETAGTSLFVAATDAERKWTAIAERRLAISPGDDSVWLRVQLFGTDDMVMVDDYLMIAKEDDDSQQGERNDADDCDDVRPLDVAVQQSPQGDVYVAVVYVESQGTSSGSNCSTNERTYFRVAKYSAASGWSLPQAPFELANVVLPPYAAIIKPLPCQAEWLATYADQITPSPHWNARRVTLDGTVGGANVDSFEDVLAISAMANGTPNCDKQDPTTLIVYAKIKDGVGSTYLRRWSTNRETGAIGRVGEDTLVREDVIINGAALQTGGRWFVAGWSVTSSSPQLWELSLTSASQPARPVDMLTPDGAGAYPGSPNTYTFFTISQVGLIGTGAGVMTAFASPFSNDSNLQSHLSEGDTGSPIAVTYTIGCQ